MVAITSNTAILASTVFTLAQLATAQSTSTVSLFVYDADPQPLVASVVGADAAATTYAIVCPDGTDSNHCGLPSPWTMTYGSTYYEVQTTEADVFSVSARCEFQTSTGDRTCTVSLGGSAANFPGLTTETLAATDVAKNSLPVVITAGLDKLAAATGGAAATTGSAASAGSSSGVPSSASNAGSSGAAATGTSHSASGSRSATGSATGSAATASQTGSAALLVDMRMAASFMGALGIGAVALAL